MEPNRKVTAFVFSLLFFIFLNILACFSISLGRFSVRWFFFVILQTEKVKRVKTTYKRFAHKLTARHSYGFGVHSPFLFGLTKFIIYNKNSFYIFEKIEALCRKRIKEKKLVSAREGLDLDLKRKKERQLLFRIVNDLRPQSILELGTELGITTLYLAAGNPNAICTAVPAKDARVVDISKNLNSIGIENVNVLETNTKEALAKIASETGKLDLVFIHPSVSVDEIRSCFEQSMSLTHNHSVFVLSEMHRIKERELLWAELTTNKNTTAYIDLFSLGFIFFRKDLARKKYKMRF